MTSHASWSSALPKLSARHREPVAAGTSAVGLFASTLLSKDFLWNSKLLAEDILNNCLLKTSFNSLSLLNKTHYGEELAYCPLDFLMKTPKCSQRSSELWSSWKEFKINPPPQENILIYQSLMNSSSLLHASFRHLGCFSWWL